VIVALGLLLTACASQPGPAAVSTEPMVQESPAPVQENMPQASEVVVATEQPQATEQNPPAAQDTIVYQIVPGESQVTYEVGETFFNQNNRFNLAIGKTSEVNGEIQVDPANPPASKLGTFTVDISQFTSDNSRRDNAIRDRFLESSRFPTATFVPTSIEDLPASYTPGEEVAFKVTGDLTVRDVTRPVTFDVVMRGDETVLEGTATTTILLSEFDVGPIEIFGILKTEDEAKLTLNFVARPVQ
jgi:polyisoprenoid-binding protein YceI